MALVSSFGRWAHYSRARLTACVKDYGTRQESKPWKQKPNRKARLKLVLTEDVHRLGVKGQIVGVKHGYGRNYLLPKELAVYATHYNIENLNAFEVDSSAVKVDEVDSLVKYLTDKTVHVRIPPGQGVVTEHHISKGFRESLRLHVPVDCIELSEPITSFDAENSVMVRLDEETLVTVPVEVNESYTVKEKRKLDKRESFLARLSAKEAVSS